MIRRTVRVSCCRRMGGLLVAALLLTATAVPAVPAAAQESWIYAPYKIRVWVAREASPWITDALVRDVEHVAACRARIVAGATWRMTCETAPDPLRGELLRSLDAVTAERILAVAPKVVAADKLMLLSIREQNGSYMLQVREWDTRTHVFGPTVSRTTPQRLMVPLLAANAIEAAFAPLARIDDVKGSTAIVRYRGAGLGIDPFCPSLPREGQALTPIIRQNDRNGNPRPNGIRQVEWTLLEAKTIQGARVECAVHTANRGYLGGRASSRIDRYGLGLRFPFSQTDLELRSRDETHRPLVGYDIYAKDPTTEEVELLGQTDWRGRLTVVPKEDHRIRLLYVRSGGMLLARLPLVPGQTDVAVCELTDDEKRLQAEAFVRGIQGTLVDLVARRELLAARIRKQLKSGNVEEAQKLVEEFRKLPSLTDMRERIDRAKQETLTENRKIQARIDKLYLDTIELLVKYLDPKLADKLATEVIQAQRAGG